MDANRQKNHHRSPINKALKKSTFIGQIENERYMKISQLQQPRKHLSSSTLIDLHQTHNPFIGKSMNLADKQGQLPHNQEVIAGQFQLQKARSLKNLLDPKSTIQSEKAANEQTAETMLRFKVEQLTLKYKAKISFLLKQLNISANEMIRFNNISKNDEILNFLSLKVRERIVKSQLTEENFIRARSKSKEKLKDFQIQKQILIKKLQEKQSLEKQLKNKLCTVQTSLMESNIKMDQKHKEFSAIADQSKQLKSRLSEQEKMIASLRQICDSSQKQFNDNVAIKKELQRQNAELVGIMQEFKTQIEQYKDKYSKLSQINKLLNEEITYWRERYEDGPLSFYEKSQSDSQGEFNLPFTPPVSSMKKSTLSLNNYGFAHVQVGNSRRFSFIPAQIDNLRYKAQIQAHYKRKIQGIIKDWKNKLQEIVNKYEDELQGTKEQLEKLQLQKQQMQRKIIVLANQKCLVQTKLIQKERQLYDLSKTFSISSINYQPKPKKQANHSDSILLSQQEIKPAALLNISQVTIYNPTTKKEQAHGKLDLFRDQRV